MHKIVRLARDTVVKECMKKITELVARRRRQHSSESTQLPVKKLRANVAVSTTAAAECPVGTAAASSTRHAATVCDAAAIPEAVRESFT